MVQFIIPVLCTPLLWIIRVLHHCTSKFYIPRFEAYLVSTRRGSGTSPCWWYTCWRFIDSSGFQMKQAECRNTPSSISMSHTENSGDELSSGCTEKNLQQMADWWRMMEMSRAKFITGNLVFWSRSRPKIHWLQLSHKLRRLLTRVKHRAKPAKWPHVM